MMSNAYVTDCDYCGEMALCVNDASGGTCCQACAAKQAERTMKNMTNNNAQIVVCPSGELNVVYTALGMNVYVNNQAKAVELFNLVDIEGLAVTELKSLGFGW